MTKFLTAHCFLVSDAPRHLSIDLPSQWRLATVLRYAKAIRRRGQSTAGIAILLAGIGILALCSAAGAQTPAAAVSPLTDTLAMQFVTIPAGRFTMGTSDVGETALSLPDGDAAQLADETPAHPVSFAQPFALGRTEVTQAQWLAVMENRPGPAENWQGPHWQQLPAVGINWFMAERFTRELSAMDPHANYRLPSEAEWEYAARAGEQGVFAPAESELEASAWFINNSGDRPPQVASRQPNAFGLYDMIGNAWEWTADWYAPDTYQRGPSSSPAGPGDGSKKVRRGGSFHCPLHMTRIAYRAADDPSARYSVLGFRVIAEPVSATN